MREGRRVERPGDSYRVAPHAALPRKRGTSRRANRRGATACRLTESSSRLTDGHGIELPAAREATRPDRRPPGESTPEPGGRRLGNLEDREVAAGQLQCLVRPQPSPLTVARWGMPARPQAHRSRKSPRTSAVRSLHLPRGPGLRTTPLGDSVTPE